MSMSEGREALWVQCGGQDAAVSRPAFLLGVVDCSRVASPPAASSESAESGATGLSVAFITRSYLLFHSRLIKADGEQKRSFRGGFFILTQLLVSPSSCCLLNFESCDRILGKDIQG